MKLPKISIEQRNVVECLENRNVLTNCVAGSGKTTCALHIASHFVDLSVLLVTYNSRLKAETREKAKKFKIKNIQVHSYHSFCFQYYDKSCSSDAGLKYILKNNKTSDREIAYDIIIFDEAQDMTKLLYQVACKIYEENQNMTTICIFGDSRQCIYEYAGADSRYITLAEKLFDFHEKEWAQCKLTKSFRVSREICLFINYCLLRYELIFSDKITKTKPCYLICNCFGDRPYEEIVKYLGMGYDPGDIFVLAPSVRSIKSPVRLLENRIKTRLPDIPIYVSTNENPDDDIVKGKILFSSFHQSKGLERPVVIIFGFDNSYFEFYNRNANQYICPNEIYVAVTRSSKMLTLLHHYQYPYFAFMDYDKLSEFCDVESVGLIRPQTQKTKDKIYGVTDMVRNLPFELVDRCMELLEIKKINDPEEKINIPTKVYNPESDTYEDVSDITGVAIPAIFEHKLSGSVTIRDALLYELVNDAGEKISATPFIKEVLATANKEILNTETLTTQDFLYISNCWNSATNGYIHKLCQITDYNWISQKDLEDCIARLESLNISKDAIFEHGLSHSILGHGIHGYMDCIDEQNNIVYEFKCTSTLKPEHYLQMAFYMVMHHNEFSKNPVNQEHEKLVAKLEKSKTKIAEIENGLKVGDEIEFETCDIINKKKENRSVITTGSVSKIFKTNGNLTVKQKDGKNVKVSRENVLKFQKKMYNAINLLLKDYEKRYHYCVFNILTNEKCLLMNTKEVSQKVVEMIIEYRYNSIQEVNDKNFIEANHELRKRAIEKCQ